MYSVRQNRVVSGLVKERVVLCAPGFPASREDSDKPFLFTHAKALLSAGLAVTVICPSVPGLAGRQMVEGIEVVRTRYAPRRFETLASTGAMYREARGFRALLVIPMVASMVLMSIREARKIKPVAIHGHWWIPGGLIAVVSASIVRTKSVVHLHGSDAAITSGRAMRWLGRRVMRAATHRLAVSEPLADWGMALCSRHVAVCPMPIRTVLDKKITETSKEGPLLGVGRLVHEKGFDVLIEAVSMLEKWERPEVVIIGSGPEDASLSAQADLLGVDLHLLGSLPPKSVADWYAKSSVVIVPSRREGFGLVAAEAAAASRAVIGTRVGGIPEVIRHGVSGLLIEPDNPLELKNALKTIQVDWGLAGPESVKNLSEKFHSDYLLDLYESDLAQS